MRDGMLWRELFYAVRLTSPSQFDEDWNELSTSEMRGCEPLVSVAILKIREVRPRGAHEPIVQRAVAR